MNRGLLACLALRCAAATGPPPDPHEVIAHSIKVAESNWSEAPNYSFIRTDSKSKHGSEPVRKAYEVLMIEGSPYLKTVAEDGHALSKLRSQEEERKLQKELAKRRGESVHERRKRLEKYNEDRNRDHALLTELAAAFDYVVTGDQQMNGYEIWVLEGKPKPGYTPPNRAAKVLSSMNVRFWIDKPSFEWLRVEAEVKQAVSIYGPIAKVGPGTRFIMEQEPVSGNLWLPKYFSMRINASALGFINEDSVQDETYTNYRPSIGTFGSTRCW